jgi:hypothetical protein
MLHQVGDLFELNLKPGAKMLIAGYYLDYQAIAAFRTL